MTSLLKLSLYVIMVIVVTKFRSATCATKSQPQRLYDNTFKERLESDPSYLSTSCLQDFSLYLQQLEEGATWALTMFDSSAKPESGVLQGGHTFLGFYSECINALPANAATQDTLHNSTVEPNFSSIYCLSTMLLTPEHKKSKTALFRPICDQLEGVDLTFAVCAPSTCNEEDVGKIAALSLRGSACTANVTSTVCRLPMKPFFEDGPALAVAVALAGLAAVVLGATLYDYKRGKVIPKCQNPTDSLEAAKNGNRIPEPSAPKPAASCTENVLLCFSLLSNGKKVFGSDGPESGSIRVLHGLRFFSMAWVICMHNGSTSKEMVSFRNTNFNDHKKFNFKTGLPIRGTLAIDTFFFMGGLVLAYSTLRQLRKNDGKKNWMLFYVHRYLRTVPLVMVVVAICAFLMRHFGDGPRWADYTAKYERDCRMSWWTYLLYVQNFVLVDHQCLGQTWYSAADFQIYLISPPILYALYKKPRLGVVISCVLAVTSITAAVTYSTLMTVRFKENFDYYRDVYAKPYFRISPYLLGMLMGLYLSNGQTTLCPPKKRYVYLGWLSCAFCLLFSVYGLWIKDIDLAKPWFGIFTTISCSLWAMGIAWIVYSSVTGCGGIFTRVLSSQALQPLSKLTFTTYIIHISIMQIFYANQEGTFYYSSYLMSYFFAGNLILSYAVSVIFCLLIELPLFNIERQMLGSK